MQLLNYLSLLSLKKKKSTAIQLEANPVNPVLWLRIKTERSQRSKAAVPVAIPPLEEAARLMPSNRKYVTNKELQKKPHHKPFLCSLALLGFQSLLFRNPKPLPCPWMLPKPPPSSQVCSARVPPTITPSFHPSIFPLLPQTCSTILHNSELRS